MKRLIALLGFLLLTLAPTPAWAHDSEWSPGPMKSDGVHPGITCRAVTSYQGHTRTWEYQMAGGHGDSAREAAWLPSFCDYAGRADAKGWFKHQEGIDVPDSAIKITAVALP